MSIRKAGRIGQGTYGIVFACAQDPNYVVKVEKNKCKLSGVSHSSLREWVIGTHNQHYNLPRAIHIDLASNSVVYPHYGSTIRSIPDLTRNEKISITQQIIRGISYAHCSLGVINRDIKTDNILYDRKTGRCVIIDWGLGRCDAPRVTMTGHMYTLWYRPPEILMGSRTYNTATDIWALGMVLLEIWMGMNVRGDCNLDQLFRYFRLWGTPTLAEWPAMTSYGGWKSTFPSWKETWSARKDVQHLKSKEPLIFDIMEQCLRYDPLTRISIYDLIHHPLLQNQLGAAIFVFPTRQQRVARQTPLGDIMIHQDDLNWNMRTILFKWLHEVNDRTNYSHQTLLLAFQTCDRVLSKVTTHRTKLQLLGIMCLVLASKMTECEYMSPLQGSKMTKGVYTVKECVQEEQHILEVVGMDVLDATPLLFIPEQEQDMVMPTILALALTNRYTCYTSHCVALAARMVHGTLDSPENPWTCEATIQDCVRTMRKSI